MIFVRAINLAEGDEVVGAGILREGAAVFTVTENGRGRRTRLEEYRLQNRGGKHDNADVCTDSKCCQAYCEPEGYIRNGGTYENVRKVFDAVMETAGQVLYYEDRLIMATYFSSAGNATEEAKAVAKEHHVEFEERHVKGDILNLFFEEFVEEMWQKMNLRYYEKWWYN